MRLVCVAKGPRWAPHCEVKRSLTRPRMPASHSDLSVPIVPEEAIDAGADGLVRCDAEASLSIAS